MEKTNKKPAPAFFCASQPIPGSYWGLILHKVCKGDSEQAARIFYRAHVSGCKDVVAWIAYGLKRVPRKGFPYALCACADETDNPGKVRAWIDREIFKLDTNRPMAKAVRDALMDLANGVRI